jgi:uncharacterized protein (TIRG00374 family)
MNPFHHKKQTQAESLRKRFFSLPTLLSFGIAISFMLFLATRFNLDWGATWANVRGMNPWLYLLAFALYYTSFAFRSLRWRLLARNTGALASPETRLPSVFETAQFIIMGWFVNAIMWLRLGDAYRAYAFAHESRGSFSWSLGTVLAERIIDMSTVFGLLIISAALLTVTSDSSTFTYMIAAAAVTVLAAVVLLMVMRAYGSRVARFLPSRLESAYRGFHQGTLGGFKQLPTLFFLGFMGWLMEIARLYFVIQALGVDIPLPLVAIVALGSALLSAVPTPGGVGAVEPGITGLLLLALARDDAVSVALVDRSITYVSVVITGGLVFLLRQVVLSRRRPQKPKTLVAVPWQGRADG